MQSRTSTPKNQPAPQRAPSFDPGDIRRTTSVLRDSHTGRFTAATDVKAGSPGLVGQLPPLYPEWLGDPTFGETHGTRFPYVAGAMANGIATVDLVVAMARTGCLGFFGAAGLSLQRVESELTRLEQTLGGTGLPWGSNLIHSPNEPALEAAVADLYIRRGVRRVSASAYMALTPSIVRYACTGLHRDNDGRIQRRHHVFAKISRPETARPFMEPAPERIVADLVAQGLLTATEAELSREIPLAEDFIVESDSGGHTDNRPLGALFPTIAAVRDEISAARQYSRPIRLGAAGGLGTPSSVAAAFALGAAFVVTGTVNQGCIESGLDATGRDMLSRAGIADVIMAPAADMFEQGVHVQVLGRETMFAVRGKKLRALYNAYPSLDAIPAADRAKVEKQILRATFDEAWESTRAFWATRDPAENTRAEAEPKHKMALVFRAYLGQASRWAINGDTDRRIDYQIWCGPAMGAFNQWVKGSFLEPAEARSAVQVALNLLEGAATITRAHQLRACGVAVPASAFDYRPRVLAAA